MTARRDDLIQALVQIQNHPAHNHHDILTITGCAPAMTEAELLRHLEANMAQIVRHSNYGGNKRRISNSYTTKPAKAKAPKKPPNEILIHLGEQGWLATFQGPHAAEIEELFESTTLPTPFTARASLADVIAAVQTKNPGAVVRHWNS